MVQSFIISVGDLVTANSLWAKAPKTHVCTTVGWCKNGKLNASGKYDDVTFRRGLCWGNLCGNIEILSTALIVLRSNQITYADNETLDHNIYYNINPILTL